MAISEICARGLSIEASTMIADEIKDEIKDETQGETQDETTAVHD